MKNKWKRRELLRHAALGALVAPLLRYWEDLALGAEGDPVRLLLVFTPNGKHGSSKWIVPNGANFDFDPAYAPLSPFKSDLVAFHRHGFQSIIERNYQKQFPSGSAKDGHHYAAKCVFTGHSPVGCTNGSPKGSQAPSIDQIVAEELVRRGVWANPLTAVLNARLVPGGWFDGNVFHTAPGYSTNKVYEGVSCPGVSTVDKPIDAFKRFFADLAQPAPSATPVPAGADKGGGFDALWARGKSMLDAPSKELVGLESTLPPEGRELLAMHLDSLRKLELSFAQTSVPPPPSTPFDLNNVTAPADLSRNAANYIALMESWHVLVGNLFRADRCRVVTLQYGGPSARFDVPELGLPCIGQCNADGSTSDPNSGKEQHAYTHHGTAADNEKFQNWFAKRMAHLLAELKGAPGGASNVLEESVVLWGMEHGNGAAHSGNDVPFLMAGQARGAIATGRWLDHENDARGHVGALKAAVHAMGLADITTIGCSEFNEPGSGKFTSAFIRGK